MQLTELGLTKRQCTALGTKNILTAADLTHYYPKRYHDYTKLQYVKNAPDAFGIFNGELIFCDKRLGKKWYMVLRMRQDDGTEVSILMFSETFRYNEISSYLHKRITVCGKPQYDDTYGWSIRYPENIRPESEFVPHIAPVYTKIQGISDNALYAAIDKAVEYAVEPLDNRLVSELRLMPYQTSLKQVHHPDSESLLRTAKQRLCLNDMIYFAEALEKEPPSESRIIFKDQRKMKELLDVLPYELTPDQKKVLSAFTEQTNSGKRFNALIQGDVGCGKTAVAIAMVACACGNGYQAVIMAPREVLARQHYQEVKGYAEKLDLHCAFLSSGMTAKQKKEEIEKIKSGDTDIIVGTHSCIADAVEYRNLGLIVTDEEHLFGVKQKEMLEAKAEEGVHSVSMSATPIPRSLATVLYGKKREIMAIKTMPPGRLPVKTAVQTSRKNTFNFMLDQIRLGRQCYVVCPAIEQNDEYEITSIEEMEKEYRSFFDKEGIQIGVVHGQVDPKDVRETIDKFTENKLQILMSTTVIEVGVNVPNASVMVIEQAERFGLASLHQLRGRVGRGSNQSYCILISKDKTNPRLQTMVRTTDGFEIAEADLEQRGSGDLLGVRQAGNNRFVNEMLKYPLLYQYAADVVRKSRVRGYKNDLSSIYGENAESAGEE